MITSKFNTLLTLSDYISLLHIFIPSTALSPVEIQLIKQIRTYKKHSGMDKHLKTSEGEAVNETRQYGCLWKYEKIVNQFVELMEMVDSVTKSKKRRRVSRKKSTSGDVATNSAPTTGQAESRTDVGEGDSSTMSSASQAEKAAELEQIITKHLSDLQSDQPLDLDSNKRCH